MELQVFKNGQFGEVRTMEVSGEVYFNNSDVCKILEIGNPSQALKRLKQDGVISNEVTDSLGRKQEMKFVSEAILQASFQVRKKKQKISLIGSLAKFCPLFVSMALI